MAICGYNSYCVLGSGKNGHLLVRDNRFFHTGTSLQTSIRYVIFGAKPIREKYKAF